MLGSLGIPEVLFIFVIALLVFGPRRLPEIGRTLGKALGEFRRATTDLKRTFDAEAASIEEVARPVNAPKPALEKLPERSPDAVIDLGPDAATDSLPEPEVELAPAGPKADSSDEPSKYDPS
jgi:sec-independent protein translocase protein TatB